MEKKSLGQIANEKDLMVQDIEIILGESKGMSKTNVAIEIMWQIRTHPEKYFMIINQERQ